MPTCSSVSVINDGNIRVVIPDDSPIVIQVANQGPPGPPGDAGLNAGSVLPAEFSGTPLTATITFSSPYPDLSYTVVPSVTSVTGRVIPVNVVNRTTTSFQLELCSTNLSGLESVNWIASSHS